MNPYEAAELRESLIAIKEDAAIVIHLIENDQLDEADQRACQLMQQMHDAYVDYMYISDFEGDEDE